jgi:hypothetical protein
VAEYDLAYFGGIGYVLDVERQRGDVQADNRSRDSYPAQFHDGLL